MKMLIESIVNDRGFKFLLGVSAYFFVIVLLLSTLGREVFISQCMFLFSVLLLVIRAIYVVINRKPHLQVSPREDIIQNALIAIGYLALIAVILGGDSAFIWLVYALIGLRTCIAIASIIAMTKVSKRQRGKGCFGK